jgi:hypothetical protein
MASSCDSFGYSFAWRYLGEDFDLYCKSTPYINNLMPTSKLIPFKPSLLSIARVLSFSKIQWSEDALAIVLVEEALPLAVVCPKEVVPVPPKNTYGQSYYA